MSKYLKIHWLTLLFLSFYIIIYIAYKPAFMYGDDSAYVMLSDNFSEGDIYWPGVFDYDQNKIHEYQAKVQARLTIILPTAIMFKFFGINEYSATIWPFFCSLLSLFLLIVAGNKIRFPLGYFMGAVYIANPLILKYATILFPDILLMTFEFLAFFMLFITYQVQSNIKLKAFVFSLALVIATLTKLMVVLIFPAMGLLFLLDMVNKRNVIFWKYVIIYTLCIFGLYFIFDFITKGDPFYIINSVGVSEERIFSDTRETSREILNRITIDGLDFISNQRGLNSLIIFGLAALSVSVYKYKLDYTKPFVFWNLISVITLLVCWFMPTSLDNYYPIPLYPRYWMVLIPPFIISTVLFIHELATEKNNKVHIISISIISILFFAYNYYYYLKLVLPAIILAVGFYYLYSYSLKYNWKTMFTMPNLIIAVGVAVLLALFGFLLPNAPLKRYIPVLLSFNFSIRILYFIFFLVTAILIILAKKHHKSMLMQLTLVGFIVLFALFDSLYYGNPNHFQKEKKYLQQYIKNTNEPVLLISDDWFCKPQPYIYNFFKQPDKDLLTFGEANLEELLPRYNKVYVYARHAHLENFKQKASEVKTEKFKNLYNITMPGYAFSIPTEWNPIHVEYQWGHKAWGLYEVTSLPDNK